VLLFVCRTFLSENLESKDERLVSEWTILRIEVGVCLEEDVSETDSEVGSINVKVLLARNVHLLATWTVDLDT